MQFPARDGQDLSPDNYLRVMPMNVERNASRINWRQALAEVAIIGAGILIALTVDSWWEERLERKAEVEYARVGARRMRSRQCPYYQIDTS